MARKLNRNELYATIVGDDQGRMFEQDGVFFGADGSEWIEPKKRGTKKDPEPAAPAADPVAPVDDQLNAQLQG